MSNSIFGTSISSFSLSHWQYWLVHSRGAVRKNEMLLQSRRSSRIQLKIIFSIEFHKWNLYRDVVSHWCNRNLDVGNQFNSQSIFCDMIQFCFSNSWSMYTEKVVFYLFLLFWVASNRFLKQIEIQIKIWNNEVFDRILCECSVC